MRSAREVREYAGNAARAALQALSTSAAEPSAMVAIGFSVAGFITSSVRRSTGSTHWPLM